MIKKSDISTLIFVAVITFFVALFFGNLFFGSPEVSQVKVQTVDPIPRELPELDERVTKGVNPTDEVTIDQGLGNPGL